MSEIITSKNLDQVIEKNKLIQSEVNRLVNDTKFRYNTSMVSSANKFAFKILKQYHLIQIPIEDKYFGGLILLKDKLRIPIINTAQPRVYQYFVAWHEVYHLLYDNSINNKTHEIKIQMEINERIADYFAAEMILGNVYEYYHSLEDEEFVDKIMRCMDTYEAPYKVILIKLYEEATLRYNNAALKKDILNNFDNLLDNIVDRFEELGLDSELVKPSYVFDTAELEKEIIKKLNSDPQVTYHTDNYNYFLNIKRSVKGLALGLLDDNKRY